MNRLDKTVFGIEFFEQTKKYAKPGDIVISDENIKSFTYDGENLHKRLKIGLDRGGVLRTQKFDPDAKDQDFDLPDALESLHELKNLHDLYLISYSGAKRAIETTKYIDKVLPDVFKGTYFVKENLYKHDICKLLELDVMIDDRIDVLNMINIPLYKIHFTGDPLYDFGPTPDDWNGLKASSWKEIMKIINDLSIIVLTGTSHYCHPKY